MTCWRCGRVEHAAWCSMPGGCDHCGWNPHRWWCLGEEYGPSLHTGDGGRWRLGRLVVLEPA
jgi:hypothetical protein